ncbi:MAG: flagellar brake protein [Gammaproteobacteria bacterium]
MLNKERLLETILDQIGSIRDKLISRTSPVPIEPEQEIKPPPSPETTKLMHRIKNSRAMLTVSIAGMEESYLSALLEVDDEEGYIVIDELSSGSGHRAICHIKEFEIKTRLEDREIKFQCELTAVGEHNGIHYYKVPFPENLDHQLRRKHLRVSTPRGKYLPVHIHTESDDLVTGELVDLSAGGFAAVLSRETSNKVKHGDVIPKCILYLGDQKPPVESELEIRYCEDKRYSAKPRLGGRFINMDQSSERRLQKYISLLDRINSRNSPTL